MAVALYRRYRPDNFDDVVGQDHVTELLKNSLDSGRTSHAYLFSGPRGCGKTTSARILARCLNCAEGPTSTPCGVCESCVELAAGGPGSLDVVEIDAASHNGVDDARELRERASFAPTRDRYKIFILDEAHMVTSAGFNALLKIVEEPPEHIKFIFATTEPEKVIGTIRSRTHHYPFRLVGPTVLLPYLQSLCKREGITVEDGVLELVIRAGGGSVRDSLSVLDQLIAGCGGQSVSYAQATGLLGYTDTSLLESMVAALGQGDGARAFQIVENAVDSGVDAIQFTKDLLQLLRDVLICALVPSQAKEVLPHVPQDRLTRMLEQAQAWGTRALSRRADQIDEALRNMSGTASARLQLELLLGRMLAEDPSAEHEAAPAPAPTPARTSAPAPVERVDPAPVAPVQHKTPAPASERPQGNDRRQAPPAATRPAAPPTPSQSEPRRPAAASTGSSNKTLAEQWAQVGTIVGQVSRVFEVVVKGTTPVELDGATLRIAPSASVRNRLLSGGAELTAISAAVKQVFGPAVEVEVGEGKRATPSTSPTSTTAATPAPSRPDSPSRPAPNSANSPAAPEVPVSRPTPPAAVEPEPGLAVAPDPTPGSTPQSAPEPTPQPAPRPAPELEREPEPPAPPAYDPRDDEVSLHDPTVETAPNRGVPAILDVLGGTLIEEIEEER